ncbi:MAG: NAD-dependent epimerase/dehydratase family protein [Candidatus Magasanikbacteria bacterium]
MNEIIRDDLESICNSDLDWERFKDRTVLISGANGMLASYMVYTLAYLNEKNPHLNIKIIALCRNLDKARARFSDFLNSPLLQISDENILNKINISEDIHYIIHAASPASPQFYGIDPVGVILPNVFGTRNLLELAREKQSNGFLFFSSGEVSGTADKKVITESEGGYLDPTDIRNCYGESKRMGENMCKCWHHQYQVPTIVVRPEHTYGPTLDLNNDKRVFSEFVSDVVNNRDIKVKSDGRPVRTFCYISDATDGFFRALLKGKSGESYHVGNSAGQMSVGNLAELLISLFPEKKLKVIYEGRGQDDNYLENKNNIRPMLSTAKIEELGYRCKLSVRDGFYRTIQSFLK